MNDKAVFQLLLEILGDEGGQEAEAVVIWGPTGCFGASWVQDFIMYKTGLTFCPNAQRALNCEQLQLSGASVIDVSSSAYYNSVLLPLIQKNNLFSFFAKMRNFVVMFQVMLHRVI